LSSIVSDSQDRGGASADRTEDLPPLPSILFLRPSATFDYHLRGRSPSLQMAYELPFGRFYLVPPTSPSPSSIVLEQSSDTPGGGWRFTLSLLSGSQLRVVLGRASSVGTMEGGLKRKEHMPSRKMEGLKVSEEALDGEEGREGGDAFSLPFLRSTKRATSSLSLSRKPFK